MKKTIKWTIIGLTFILTLPFGLLAKAERFAFGSTFIYQLFAQLFCIFPGAPGMFVRACYYKQTLKQSHLDFDIGFGSIISKMDTEIGRSVFINAFNIIGLSTIGDGVVIANYVSLLSGRNQHNFSDPETRILDGDDTVTRITIGAETFIGDKSVVMANIGEKTIVGAGSIVVKDIPAYSIAVGNPARVVKSRNVADSKDKTITEQS